MTMTGASPATPPSSNALRIVLFGMPDAGKSSLLGALAQAAQVQERVLQGRLTDQDQRLVELQRRVYDDRPRETLEEIVPYPISYDPFKNAKPDPEQRIEAVLYDCDGRVANEILQRHRQFGDAAAGSLAQTLLRADAIILVIDASASPEQVDHDFAEFARFLEHFEMHRSSRSEVGGLPVYLVLSKCDLLLKPDETASVWNDHIEERKKQVQARFKEFLEEDSATSGFGSLDVDVGATAVRRPPLSGSPGAKEPVGVADLFRRCFHDAQEHRQRVQRSRRRLTMTVAASLLAILLLGGGATALYFTQDSLKPNPVEAAVEAYRSAEGATAPERLAEPLQRKISELTGIQQNPDYGKLPRSSRDYVSERLQELTAYRKYRDDLFTVRPPGDLRSLEELAQLEEKLKTRHQPPAEYAAEWRTTDAVLLREKWLDDATALRAAAHQVDAWFAELRGEAGRLLYQPDQAGTRTALPWPIWHEQFGKLEQLASNPRFRPTDRIPTTKAPAPGKAALTYETVFTLTEIAKASRDWDDDRARLTALRDVSHVLGLSGAGSGWLKFSEAVTAEEITQRLAGLKKQCPKFVDWALTRLPDAVAPDVRAAASVSYERVLRYGQAVVMQQLKQAAPDSKESHARWLTIADTIGSNAALQDFRAIAPVLARLSGAAADDPMSALVAFLKERSFAIRLAAIKLTLPDDLPAARLRPTGPLTVYFNDGTATTSLLFSMRGDGQREPLRRLSIYTFAPDGTDRFTFTPGNEIWAELPLRDADGKEWKLTWLQCRSAGVYSFERLVRTPRLHPADEKNPLNGSLAKDTFLTVTPESGLPRVPDLLPVVRFQP